MDKALYVAMSGAKQTMIAQAIHSHNLANSKTVGFAADMEQARSMPVYGDGYPDRVYAMIESPASDLHASALITTNNPLDVALSGNGFLAVQDANGQEAYTRAGNLHFDELGRLKNGANHLVLGQGGPISAPPAEKVDINPDGTISFVPLGASEPMTQILDRLRLVKADPKDFTKGTDGLFRTTKGTPLEPNASVTLTPGALNASNVDAMNEMVSIISLARQFEMQVKLMNQAAENEEQTSDIMRMNG
jgi:flagellar basal-body rod protein FlgF